MLISRLLSILIVFAAAAYAVTPAARLKSNYELALKTQELTEALVKHQSREVYRVFAPAFSEEHSFARFDSALDRWYRGRRIVRASHKVVDIKGPSGHVSCWVVFDGSTDYDYVYENWLNTGKGWQLLWMSRVLDSGFAYGQADRAGLVRIAEAGLNYLLSKPGLARFNAGFVRPDTLVMVSMARPGEGDYSLAGSAVKWVMPDAVGPALAGTGGRFCVRLALVRRYGDIALAVFDVATPGLGPAGGPRRPHGMEVYVELKNDRWRFRDVGKVW